MLKTIITTLSLIIIGTVSSHAETTGSSKACTDRALNPPKYGCGSIMCGTIKRAAKRNDLAHWKRTIASVERYLDQYPDCRAFLNECIACANNGLKSPQIKQYALNKSLWKSSGEVDYRKAYYVPMTVGLKTTDPSIEGLNESCARQDKGICATRDFAKTKLCPLVINVTKRMANSMLNGQDNAFRHLVRNNGIRETAVEWRQGMFGGSCSYGVRVEGLYAGSTINKWYWGSSNRFVPAGGSTNEYILDLEDWQVILQ